MTNDMTMNTILQTRGGGMLRRVTNRLAAFCQWGGTSQGGRPLVRWSGVSVALLFLLAVGGGVAEAQTPVPSVLSEYGYYLIQNENNDKMYYLIPSPHQLYQSNAATPYLRTALPRPSVDRKTVGGRRKPLQTVTCHPFCGCHPKKKTKKIYI